MKQLCHPIRYVITDDHQLMRRGIESSLKMAYPNDYVLLFEAANGEDLLAQLNSATVLPDIIFLDVSMPHMNGYEALSNIRRKWSDLKVLGISMYNEDEVVTKMLYNGVNGFITKDSSAHELHAAVTEILCGRYYFQGVSPLFTSKTVDQLKRYLPNITDKEMKFLSLCATEMRYEDMAMQLGLSVRSVHSYRDILFDKFNINNRVGLAFIAIKLGLLPNVDLCHGGPPTAV